MTSLCCRILLHSVIQSKDVKGFVRKHSPPAAGCEVVFHCATAAPAAANTANRKLMHDVNVRGTQNIIEACASQVTPSGFMCILILHHNQPVPLKHERYQATLHAFQGNSCVYLLRYHPLSPPR